MCVYVYSLCIQCYYYQFIYVCIFAGCYYLPGTGCCILYYSYYSIILLTIFIIVIIITLTVLIIVFVGCTIAITTRVCKSICMIR